MKPELAHLHKALRHPLPALNVLLGLWALVMLALLLRTWITEPEGPPATGSITASGQNAQQALSWNWFASTSAAASQEALAAATAELEEAGIDAELIGVVMGRDHASATIKVGRAPEKVYGVGDELASGVVLASVGITRVVLDERGRQTRLSMRRSEGIIQTGEAAGNTGSAAGNNVPAGFALANMFAAAPVELDDGGTGLQVSSLSDEMRSLTAIENGDVITRVGNDDIQSLLTDSSRWMNYSLETNLPVTVLRDGNEIVLTINAFSLSANLTSELMP